MNTAKLIVNTMLAAALAAVISCATKEVGLDSKRTLMAEWSRLRVDPNVWQLNTNQPPEVVNGLSYSCKYRASTSPIGVPTKETIFAFNTNRCFFVRVNFGGDFPIRVCPNPGPYWLGPFVVE